MMGKNRWVPGVLLLILAQGIPNLWLRTAGVTVIALGIAFFLKQLLAERRQLLRLVAIDELTELGNYRAFQERIKIESQRSLRQKSPLTLILIDLDQFKSYNDSHGHRKGNELLKGCARALGEAVRSADGVYRFGGDEFAIILADTGLEQARFVTQRIRQAFEGLAIRDMVTLSMGMAVYAGETLDEFFDRVDTLLYEVKLHGGDCCQTEGDNFSGKGVSLPSAL